MTGAKMATIEYTVEMRSSRTPNHLADDMNINQDSAWWLLHSWKSDVTLSCRPNALIVDIPDRVADRWVYNGLRAVR